MFGQERADPALVRVFRHPAGIPQYTVGHLQRVASVRAAQARHQGLYFVGNHLQGIGVKDCAREGEKVAGQVRAYCG
jgi:oxygen-dependent protoporphyrinogen oxidase